MERYVHSLSAFLFYTLGILFFTAYICSTHALLGLWPSWIFEVFDMPFVIAAMLYGGTSIHLSLRRPNNRAIVSGIIITIVLLSVFSYIFVLNYWNVFGLPTVA